MTRTAYEIAHYQLEQGDLGRIVMGARRRLLAVVVAGLTASLLLAGCGEDDIRERQQRLRSQFASAAADSKAGWEFKGPAHVTDTVWKFDGMATADLMFNADGSVLYVDFWYEIASGKAFFGFSGVADPVAGTLRFETCPSNYGQAGPMPATGSGTYTPTQASGSGSCKNYQSWKGGSDGDLTFSFDGIPRVIK